MHCDTWSVSGSTLTQLAQENNCESSSDSVGKWIKLIHCSVAFHTWMLWVLRRLFSKFIIISQCDLCARVAPTIPISLLLSLCLCLYLTWALWQQHLYALSQPSGRSWFIFCFDNFSTDNTNRTTNDNNSEMYKVDSAFSRIGKRQTE